MSNNRPHISFDNEKWSTPQRHASHQTFSLVRLVIAYSGGFIRTEAQATYVLLGITIIVLVLAVSISFSDGASEYVPQQYEVPPPGWEI